MGWETRGSRRVYYRKERYTDEQGRSRVRSLYCGSGERGEKAAREDEERRAACATPVADIEDVKKESAEPPFTARELHARAYSMFRLGEITLGRVLTFDSAVRSGDFLPALAGVGLLEEARRRGVLVLPDGRVADSEESGCVVFPA